MSDTELKQALKDCLHLLEVAIQMKRDHSSQADAVTQMMAREEWPHFVEAVERFKIKIQNQNQN